jgi:hypothetical protein
LIEYSDLGDPICGLPLEDTCILLPVELISFDATTVAQDIELSWITATEVNSGGFEIQHHGPLSGEVRDRSGPPAWETLAFIPSDGGSVEKRSYSHRLRRPDPGLHRFRLKLIDIDGSYAYSAIVEVIVEMVSPFLLESAYPNPFSQITIVRFAVRETGPVEVILYDMQGRQIETLYRGTPPEGMLHELRIGAQELSNGVYLVALEGAGYSTTREIVVTK